MKIGFCKKIAVLALLLFVTGITQAASVFKIDDIRVEGLQRITAGTVFNYLPVKPGDNVSSSNTPAITKALYQTGFFKDVRLEREGNVLVIYVRERPAIYEINFTGNKSIEEDALKEGLKDAGLASGRTFNRSVLSRIEQELRRLFYSRGKYGIKLTSTVTPLERNRVSIDVEIAEGRTALIKQINIVGNKTFEEEDLLDQFKLTTGGWLSWWTADNQYSREKLAGDLERLRSYYMDRGYIRFDVSSTQVSISPDKQDIYITINVEEGDVYSISDIHIAGELEGEVEDYFPLIRLRRGEPFKRRDVVDSNERVSRLLSDRGYAFANVNNIPEIDEENKSVAITFFVDLGKRTYVRRVNIKGNTKTRDEVIRRELRQLDSSWFSSEKLKLSKERIDRTGYFSEVSVSTPSVPGSTDEVDVEIKVAEKPSGALLAGFGYSQAGGFTLSTSINQDNFMGSGKKFGFAFSNNDAKEEYGVSYGDPYYTIDGISRNWEVKYKSTDFSELNSADYATDDGVISVRYGLPLNEFNRVNLGFAFHAIDFKVGTSASTEINNFVTNNGDNYYNLEISTSWNHDSRDSALFPMNGTLQRLGGEITTPGSSLTYFKIGYSHREYWSLSKEVAFSLNGSFGHGMGYGDTNDLPFFENYFAGGLHSIRGFKSSSLGPRDSTNDPLGSNTKIVGNAELLLPSPTGAKNMRWSTFFDVGAVYDAEQEIFDTGELRYSMGVGFSWLSPVGPLSFSVAQPFNADSKDQTETFQFALGTTF